MSDRSFPFPSASQATYGVDAPGVVRGFFAAALGLLAAGLVLAALPGVWTAIGAGLAGLALIPCALGLSMLAYSWQGKKRLRDRLLSERAWRGDETVLDVGAGRGLMAIGAARRVPRGRVYALDVWSARDLTGNTPDALRANAVAEGVAGRIHVLDADARTIPLDDESVDVVLSVFCLHNIEPASERETALAEIVRVLAPGGVALIADFPGAGPYVEPLRAAGLTVADPRRAEATALGVAGYLVATKR